MKVAKLRHKALFSNLHHYLLLLLVRLQTPIIIPKTALKLGLIQGRFMLDKNRHCLPKQNMHHHHLHQ